MRFDPPRRSQRMRHVGCRPRRHHQIFLFSLFYPPASLVLSEGVDTGLKFWRRRKRGESTKIIVILAIYFDDRQTSRRKTVPGVLVPIPFIIPLSSSAMPLVPRPFPRLCGAAVLNSVSARGQDKLFLSCLRCPPLCPSLQSKG